MELLHELAYVSPRVLAGLLSHGLGLSLVIVFGSLYPQLVPMAGRRGLVPIHDALRAIERDFPTPRRFLYFPTLLWLNASDRSLRLIGGLGLGAAVLITLGGPATPYLFGVCWLALLSLDRAMTLVYPWDSALFEAVFWGMFLPTTAFASGLAADSGCQPAVLWAYRLLVFRIMLGFGKHKFLGTTAQDLGFLRGFFVTMPLPTRIGWLAQKLPMWVMKLGLVSMFIIEIPLPFGIFFPGPWSALFGVATIFLMLAIWATGNFGFFNVAMSIITLACFDNATAAQLQLFAPGAPAAVLAIDALFVLHTFVASVAFPFNTFCSHTWMMWSPWLRVTPRGLTWPVDLARALQPFRFAHAYGVFSPRSGPAARITAVGEATWDDETWHELVQPIWPTNERSVPVFCAPHHERFDQAAVYESIGLNESSPYRNILGRWDPYGHGAQSAVRSLMQRVLAADLPGSRFYDRSLERRLGPPRAVRVRSYMLEPASLEELRSSGRWWRRTLIGPHYGPLRQGEGYFEEPLPEPELWHYDDIYWLRRSRMGELLRRAAAGEPADSLVSADAPELSELIQPFWDELVPLIHARHRASFTGLRATVSELRERYGHRNLRCFERLANRYALCLYAKLEPLFLRGGWAYLKDDWRPAPERAALPARSFYELRSLCMAIVAEGRQTFQQVLQEPQLAAAHLERLTMFEAHQLQAAFRYETFVFHAGKLRLLDHMSRQAGRAEPSARQRAQQARMEALVGRLWGAVPFIEFLKTQFLGPEDVLDTPEQWPCFTVAKSTEVLREPVRRRLHAPLASE